MKNRFFFIFLIFSCVQIFLLSSANGQTFTTNANGNWNTAAIWTRSNFCGVSGQENTIGVNHQSPAPTNSPNPACAEDAVINHTVTKTGGTEFSQRFRSLRVNPIGFLQFTGSNSISFTNNAYGAVEIIIDGGKVELYDMQLSNGVVVRVINDGELIVKNNLTTSGSSTRLTVDASSSVTVTNTTTIASGHYLDINGRFSSTNLVLNSAITTFGSTSSVTVANDLNLSSGSLTISGDAEVNVGKDFTASGSATFTGSGNSNIAVGRNFSNGSSGNFNFSNNTAISVGGNFTNTNSSTIRFSNDSQLAITGNLSNSNGSIYAVGEIKISVQGNLTQSSGQSFGLAENTDLEVGGTFTQSNGTFSSSGQSTVEIIGNLTKSAGTLSMSNDTDWIVQGNFSNSNGPVNILNNTQVLVSGSMTHSGGTITANEFTDIRIGQSLTSTGGTYNAYGNSFLGVAGNHTVTQWNSPYNLYNNAQIQVQGTTSSPWGGMNVFDYACYKSTNKSGGAACVLCGDTFTTNGTFTVPADVTEITVELWGGGAAGGTSTNFTNGSGGGGGGAYSRRTLSVIPGQTLSIFVGSGGNQSVGNGGISYVSTDPADSFSNSLIFARGGTSPASNTSSGGAGGTAMNTTELGARPNSTSFNGGSGFSSNGNQGGYGGSAAANDGSATSAGSDPLGEGGPGGQGGYYNQNGSTPPIITFGGGGGGSRGVTQPRIGGNGAGGLVKITFTCPIPEPCTRVVDFGTNGEYYIVEYFCDGIWEAPEALKEFGVTAIGGGGGGGYGNTAAGGQGGQVSSTSKSDLYYDINTKPSNNEALGLPAGTVFTVNVGYGGYGGTASQNGQVGQPSTLTGSFVDFLGNTVSYSHVGAGGVGGGNSPGTIQNGLSIPAAVTLNRPALPGLYGASGGNANSPTGGNGGGGNGSSGGLGGNGVVNSGSGGGGGATGGGQGGSGKIFIYYPLFRILPVEFLYFNAKYNPTFRSGDLTWSTAKEWENSHFEIERAVNSVKEWETVGQVKGAGYSDQPVDYSYQDMKLPLAGGNIFYRLKQLDFDGDSTYSDTKSIRVEPLPGVSYWRVYPNPTTGNPINLELLDNGIYHDELVTVRIISPTGQYDVIESKDSAINALVSNRLSTKAVGIYTLEISWGIYREYHKVILRR